jgi:hypothetical protein
LELPEIQIILPLLKGGEILSRVFSVNLICSVLERIIEEKTQK